MNGAPIVDCLLHSRIVDAVVHENVPRAVQIWGGRGMGKSRVIDAIARELVDAVVVRCREPEGRSALERELKTDVPLLIDDLDVLFTLDLSELLRQARDRSRQIVFTSSTPPDLALLCDAGAYKKARWPVEIVRGWSNVTLQFHQEEIDAWPVNWQNRVSECVRGCVGAEYRSDVMFVAEWTTAIVQLTGGHPTLLEAALAEATRLFAGESSDESQALLAAGSTPRQRRRRIYSHLEDFLFSSVAFRQLRHNVRATTPEAYEYLARETSEGDIDAPVEVRRVLTDSGLVYRNPRSGLLVIAGELLRRAFVARSTSRMPTVAISATPGSEEKGLVTVEVGGDTASVEVRGSAWRIIRRLDLDRDQVVPVDELIQAGKVDHAGVRSAIQRVKAELHEVGIGGLIENVRGQGYQLCDFPLLGVSRET